MNAKKKQGIIVGGALALVMVLLLLLLPSKKTGNQPEATSPPATTVPVVDARGVYTAAKQAVEQAEGWKVTYTTAQNRNIGAKVFSQSVTGTADYAIIDGELSGCVTETRKNGMYSDTYQEIYCKGKAYAEMAELVFQAEMDSQTFLQRQVPAILLDSSLYGSISGYWDQEGIFLHFTDAVALENWMAPEQAELISASGTVRLDEEGNLLVSSYVAEFLVGNVTYTYSATARFASQVPSQTHSHYESAQPIGDLDVLKVLMQVVGDLFVTSSIQCQAEEIIDCPQIPLAYFQKSEYGLRQTVADFSAVVTHTTSITDYRGQAAVQTQTDRFQNGSFTSVTTDGESVKNPEMTQQKMRQVIEDAVLAAIMAPNYLADATRENSEDSFTIHMTGNDAFCRDLMDEITEFLQVDLDALATSYETPTAGGYLTIDKTTMLPVAMGITFQRVHTVSDVGHTLTYSMEHTLQLFEE